MNLSATREETDMISALDGNWAARVSADAPISERSNILFMVTGFSTKVYKIIGFQAFDTILPSV